MTYNESEGIIETAFYLFIDDLELDLKKYALTDLNLGSGMEHPTSDSLVRMYVDRNAALVKNDTLLKWHWVGKELSEDLTAFWLYAYVEWDGKGSIAVINRMLLTLFEDQKNIIDFRFNNDRYMDILTKNKTKSVLITK